MKTVLLNIYRLLRKENGHLGWWPADNDFEVCVGAILTQNTSWQNVEKAIISLKSRGLNSPESILKEKLASLSSLIRPAGYFNQKAQYLKEFCKFLKSNSLADLKTMDTATVRKKLLSVKGIGNETADSIILYALRVPVFVIDAYTVRIFSRLGFMDKDTSYEDAQSFFMNTLPLDQALFSDYHAQIVELAKRYCKKKPICDTCPLRIEKICKYN